MVPCMELIVGPVSARFQGDPETRLPRSPEPAMKTQEPFLERPWSRRRIVRWVSRALLTGLVLAAAGLCWLVGRASVQATTVAAIRTSGGKVYYDWEMTRTSRPD